MELKIYLNHDSYRNDKPVFVRVLSGSEKYVFSYMCLCEAMHFLFGDDIIIVLVNTL